MSHRPTDDLTEEQLDVALTYMRRTGASFEAAAHYARRAVEAPARYAARREAGADDDFGERELEAALHYMRRTG
ncbi:MAG TPA: hypothetical protein VFW33_03870, partial [Gemmataceae bacterium]|nr:hypothetical protein [Gemmataceae bacterium]